MNPILPRSVRGSRPARPHFLTTEGTLPVLDPKALIDNRVAAIRDFHASINEPRAQLDVSGGIDSAVMLALLALALGPENVTAVHSGIHTNPEQTERAREVAEVFGVNLIEFDLTSIYMNLVDDMIRAYNTAQDDPAASSQDLLRRMKDDPAIKGSIRSTIRAPIGRGFNRLAGGGIRHGTGNECEDRWTRFYQKGGDGEVDINPIAMLSKAEVYQLALALGVPKSTITATPSPDLWGSGDIHNDEDEFAACFMFAASDHGHTFYGYIDVETGAYRSVGLIERVSRFLDSGTDCTDAEFLDDPDMWERLCERTHNDQPFHGLSDDLIESLLVAARRIEKMTRHKWNPNCPTLGDRSDLVEAGILTNTLPNL